MDNNFCFGVLMLFLCITLMAYYLKNNYEWFINPDKRTSTSREPTKDDNNFWYPTLWPHYPYYPDPSCIQK
jgi:hypothetical protein